MFFSHLRRERILVLQLKVDTGHALSAGQTTQLEVVLRLCILVDLGICLAVPLVAGGVYR